MAKEAASTPSRGVPATVFLVLAIGVLAVGNVVFLLLWLLSPIAGGPGVERGGRRVEVRCGPRVLRIAEGIGEGPAKGFETRLSGQEFEELAKMLTRLAQASRGGEQAEEFFKSDAGRDAKPAVTIAFPRPGVGTESLEVYVADVRRQVCYCRLRSTGEALGIKLDQYEKIASDLSHLGEGAAGSFPVPHYMPIGEPLRARLAGLQGPLTVTTVSLSPRDYLCQVMSSPALVRTLALQQPDAATVTASVRLPDRQAMTCGLADSLARGCDKVTVQHLDTETQLEAVQKLAQALKRPLEEIIDALVLQYGDRVRIVRSAEMLLRDPTGTGVPGPARFEGEKVLAQAFDDLLAERGLVCFAEGHGERRIGERGAEGFSQVAEGLSARGFRASSVDLASAKALPPDCQALVVAGPRKAFEPSVEKAVVDYLEKGGRVALLLDPPDGVVVLGDFLKRCGLTVPDPKKVLEVRGRYRQANVFDIQVYPDAEFARKWARTGSVFFTACEVAVGSPAEGAACEALRLGGPLELQPSAKPPCILAAVRPTGAKGPKLLVFGDTDAFANSFVEEVRENLGRDNLQLLVNAIAWLTE
jgi:hypothetical protein